MEFQKNFLFCSTSVDPQTKPNWNHVLNVRNIQQHSTICSEVPMSMEMELEPFQIIHISSDFVANEKIFLIQFTLCAKVTSWYLVFHFICTHFVMSFHGKDRKEWEGERRDATKLKQESKVYLCWEMDFNRIYRICLLCNGITHCEPM